MRRLTPLALLACLAGCATAPTPRPDAASTGWVALNRSPVHLGDLRYSGQSFNQARTESHSWCALVRLPRAAAASIRIDGLRNTEQPTNQIRIDGESSMLPMLLSQRAAGESSLGTQTSLTWSAAFDAGPHEICVVAGVNPMNPTDIDDFEFSAILVRADGVSPREIEARVVEGRREVPGALQTAQYRPWSPGG